jgi:hypothetical protein
MSVAEIELLVHTFVSGDGGRGRGQVYCIRRWGKGRGSGLLLSSHSKWILFSEIQGEHICDLGILELLGDPMVNPSLD